jgi:ADP-heptose:LPS heptosyltransferase
VAIIRIRSLGDCVLTTPAIRLLKAHRPDIRLGVVVEDRFAPVFEGNPDVNAILPVSIPDLALWKPVLCLNLHGGTQSIGMTVASRADFRAGFDHHFWAATYNVRIPTAQEILGVDRKVHTAEHLASAMFYLGVPVAEIPRARLVPGGLVVRRPYAVIHPFASAPEKTWARERFAAVARHIQDTYGLEPLILAGPEDDPSGWNGYEVLTQPLDEVKNLMSGAALFVGNDSGPAHMAAAFGVPVVALFGASDPEIWAPWRTDGAALTHPEGMSGIRVEDVIAAIDARKVDA